jgi:hypothetical protein
VSEELNIRQSLVVSPDSLNEFKRLSPKSPRHIARGLGRDLQRLNLMLAQCVVYKCMCGLLIADIRCKDIVEPELARKDVL